MYNFSDEFARRQKRSHKQIVRAEVYKAGLKLADLNVDGGSVTIDRNAAFRRHCRLDVTSNELLARTAADLLWPAGNEIRLYAGIAYGDWSEEFPLGVFRIAKPATQDDGLLTATVEGWDRSRSVSRAKFQDVYSVAAGVNYATAIRDLVLSRRPGTVFNFMPTSQTTPLLVFTSKDDPWSVAQTMATSLGAELFFDADGICVLRPEPDPLASPIAWEFEEGEEATIISVGRSVDDERTYNGWIVTGESSSNAAPVRAEAWDMNPDSPTYRLGPYGEAPGFYTSQYITTVAQAQAVADAMLLRNLGFIENVEFTAVTNFAHDGGDIITIEREKSAVTGRFVCDMMELPLGIDANMRVTTRKREV